MCLNDLMKFEEQLLLFEYQNKFNIPFSDYIILEKILVEVENITNLYFKLIDSYTKSLEEQNIEKELQKTMLIEFNNKMLNSEIEINLTKFNDFIEKYIKK